MEILLWLTVISFVLYAVLYLYCKVAAWDRRRQAWEKAVLESLERIADEAEANGR